MAFSFAVDLAHLRIDDPADLILLSFAGQNQ